MQERGAPLLACLYFLEHGLRRTMHLSRVLRQAWVIIFDRPLLLGFASSGNRCGTCGSCSSLLASQSFVVPLFWCVNCAFFIWLYPGSRWRFQDVLCSWSTRFGRLRQYCPLAVVNRPTSVGQGEGTLSFRCTRFVGTSCVRCWSLFFPDVIFGLALDLLCLLLMGRCVHLALL